MPVRLTWYWQRARVMSAGELVGRMRRLVRERTMAWPGRRNALSAAELPAFCRGDGQKLVLEADAAAVSDVDLDLVLQGTSHALGWPWCWREDPQCWMRAPDTGRIWPDVHYARIDYRPGNRFGDARVIWEPSRLQWLVPVALAARAGRRPEAAADQFERVLAHWLAANPPYRGVHYVSAMECALRMLAVLYAVDLLRPWLLTPAKTWNALLDLVDSHARLIAARLSRHSSSGNHTIAEATALVHAGLLFPELAEASDWLFLGRRLLAAEFPRQVLDDGGGIEQAPGYLAFVVDLLTLAESVLAPAGLSLGQGERVVQARRFLADLGDAAIGDADDGAALTPLLCRPQVAAPGTVHVYPQSGYVVLRAPEAGTRLIFDHGPLGMPPGCGHGHADALSVLLWRQGRWLLADAGTFGYGADAAARACFRGTAAHNTIRIDGADQSVQTGPFLWRAPFQGGPCLVQETDDAVVLRAASDAYARLGVQHCRTVVFGRCGNVLVEDLLSGTGLHQIELSWHPGPPVTAGPDGRFVAAGGPFAIEIEGVRSHCEGSWRSPAYGHQERGMRIVGAHHGPLPVRLRTFLHLDQAGIGARRLTGHLATPAEPRHA